jgi:fluoroacetyl-CoA thioesterase
MSESMDTKRLEPGLAGTLSFTVPANKTVPFLYPEAPEFQTMPHVFATGFLVGLVEWACMRLIAPYLDVPAVQTVGTDVKITHSAATPPGLDVTVNVRLDQVEGRKLVFSVTAHDGIDVICRGTHERYVIETAPFVAKASRKAPRGRA